MKIEKIRKESFTVIGKEGSTDDGAGFIQRLWDDANGHFDQVADLAKRDENGDLAGVWGTMSDFSKKDCILQVLSVQKMQLHRKVGRNGLFQAMYI